MRKYFFLILIVLGLFAALAYILDFGSLLYGIVNSLVSMHSIDSTKIQVIGVFIYAGLGVIFAVGGYYSAKRKNRNVWIWAIACFLWNLWAYLLILCLPPKKSKPDG